MLYPYVREAHHGDIPEIARLSSKAFWHDDLLGDRIHPHREKYPDDFDLYWLQRVRVHYFDPRWRFIVAIDQDPSGCEVIAGCGQWSRMGEGGKAMDYQWFDPRMFHTCEFPSFARRHVETDADMVHTGNYTHHAMALAMKGHAIIWPNRAADRKEEDVIERVMPYVADSWTGDRGECWYLEVMAVRPDFQGKGIGRKLVGWGLQRAEDEGVYACVISAKGKEPFYQKCGFVLEDGHVGRGEGNPLAEWQGGRMLWRVPDGKR